MTNSLPLDQKMIEELLATGFVWDQQTKCYIATLDVFHVSVNPETKSIFVTPIH
jgi:hypothetical protein